MIYFRFLVLIFSIVWACFAGWMGVMGMLESPLLGFSFISCTIIWLFMFFDTFKLIKEKK